MALAVSSGFSSVDAQESALPIAMIPAAERTSEQWMEYLGIQLVETRDASGPAVLSPEPGDVYFLTNESTTWGATNKHNNAVFINAKTRELAGQSQLPDEYALGFGSHGIAASADGKYIYLPALKSDATFLLVLDGETLNISKVYHSLGRPHHVTNFTGPDGRELIMVIDFGWNFLGSGMWVLDPAQDNIVVGGMSRQDFSGGPYIASGDVNGNWMYVTVPAPMSAVREEMEGYLAKVNMETWMVEAVVPMMDPIWPEVSLDGKMAWVTLGGPSKVVKVDLETNEIVAEMSTGPGPWGARLSYDNRKLYIADKGETGGYGQQGITMTVLDTHNDIVTNVVPIGKTTDHIILSPDGKEVWATSNAEHGIWVVDTETEEVVGIIDMPNDGDSHGSTFIQYSEGDQGSVVAEVVSGFTGLRGSALVTQREFVAQPVIDIAINRDGFAEGSVDTEPGQIVRLIVENVGGTNTGVVTFESPELGIEQISLEPGQSHEQTWTVPAEPGQYTATTNKTPNDTLTVHVMSHATPVAEMPADGSREIPVDSTNFVFDPTEITVAIGETVVFVLHNGDDEKHNMVGLGENANLLSPDVDPGQTTSFEWTAPSTAITFDVICTYHPDMVITLIVE